MSIRHERFPIAGGGEYDVDDLVTESLPVPTKKQLEAIYDGQTSGEQAFSEKWPELNEKLDTWFNERQEELVGPETSHRDLAYLLNQEFWTRTDLYWLNQITINPATGCWRLPFYTQETKGRARYPQRKFMDHELGRKVNTSSSRFFWQRLVGGLRSNERVGGVDSEDKTSKPVYRVHHACEEKDCVYPRHHHLGTQAFNDAEKLQLEAIREVQRLQTIAWQRPSPGLPEGITQEMIDVLGLQPATNSNRAVMLPVVMSKIELEELVSQLHSHDHNYLPYGYTTDPGYHLAKACILSGNYRFDDRTGCFLSPNTRSYGPAKDCLPFACGNAECFNPRHLDLIPDSKKCIEIQPQDYVTLPDKSVRRNKYSRLESVLPPYWLSWDLYMNWMIPRSAEFDHDKGHYVDKKDYVLSAAGIETIWVHPLTGCWELGQFYLRWDQGVMSNGYGYNRDKKHPAGRAAHRKVLYEYLCDHYGPKTKQAQDNMRDQLTDLFRKSEVDHMCENRRCCNPTHLQLEDKKTHNRITFAHMRNTNAVQPTLFEEAMEDHRRNTNISKRLAFEQRQRRRERGYYVPKLSL